MTNTAVLSNDERNAIVRSLTKKANSFHGDQRRREMYQSEAHGLRTLPVADLSNLSPDYVARLNRMVQA